jgi:hypothetical protein
MFSVPNDPLDSAFKNKANTLPSGQQQGSQGKDVAAAAPGQQAGSKSRTRERKFENGDRYRGGWLNGLVRTLLNGDCRCIHGCCMLQSYMTYVG